MKIHFHRYDFAWQLIASELRKLHFICRVTCTSVWGTSSDLHNEFTGKIPIIFRKFLLFCQKSADVINSEKWQRKISNRLRFNLRESLNLSDLLSFYVSETDLDSWWFFLSSNVSHLFEWFFVQNEKIYEQFWNLPGKHILISNSRS